MNEPTVAVVRDQDGHVHFASASSSFVVNGLTDGSLTRVEERDDAEPKTHQPGDDHDASGPDDRLTDGSSDDAGTPRRQRGSSKV